jgi:hypothetical protein
VAYAVSVEPSVRIRFRAFGLSRNASVRVWATLHDALANHAHLFIGDRVGATYFRYQYAFRDGGSNHTLTFLVDDQRQSHRLFIVDVFLFTSKP